MVNRHESVRNPDRYSKARALFNHLFPACTFDNLPTANFRMVVNYLPSPSCLSKEEMDFYASIKTKKQASYFERFNNGNLTKWHQLISLKNTRVSGFSPPPERYESLLKQYPRAILGGTIEMVWNTTKNPIFTSTREVYYRGMSTVSASGNEVTIYLVGVLSPDGSPLGIIHDYLALGGKR